MAAIDVGAATWPEVAARLPGAVAVLPFGALEQHGPHLPLDTDTRQAGGIAARVADAVDGLLLPPVHYGETWNSAGYPGTLSLAPDTVTAICVDLADALQRSGALALVVVNGDFGNRAPLRRAARLLAVRGGLPVLVLDYPGLQEVADRIKDTPWAAPGLCHADELETSMVLALAPDLVRVDRAVACYPDLPADFGHRERQLHDLSESGVFGDPRTATAAKGEAILAEVVGRSVAMVRNLLAALEREGVAAPNPGDSRLSGRGKSRVQSDPARTSAPPRGIPC